MVGTYWVVFEWAVQEQTFFLVSLNLHKGKGKHKGLPLRTLKFITAHQRNSLNNEEIMPSACPR
jgi:hypothetical protein